MHVLYNYFTYLFLIIIIPSYASQTKIALQVDIHESMLHYLEDAHNNFLNENYTQAALSASCFISYAQGHATDGIKKRSSTPFCKQEELNHAHYIFASSHLNNVCSQQLPHKSLDAICNVPTSYGTLTPSLIVEALLRKSHYTKQSNERVTAQLQVTAQHYKYEAPYIYYQQAIAQNNNSHINAALRQIQNISDNQSNLRKCLIQLINKNFITRTSSIDKLFSLETEPSFDSNIKSLIVSDAAHIIPLLKKNLSAAKNPSAHCNNLHYALGLMLYYQQDYINALFHLQKTKFYQTDLITQCRVFDTLFHIAPDLSYDCACQVTDAAQLMLKPKKASHRTSQGILLKNNLLTQHAPSIAFVLTEYQDYQKALILAQLCTQQNETYQTGLDIITFVQNALNKTIKNHSVIISSHAYDNVIQHFTKEKDAASLQFLSNIIVNHILYNNALIYDHLAIHCIEHVLQGDALSEENRTRLHAICGEFYYIQSKKTSSQSLQTEHLRNAIKHNHTEAIFEKVTLYCDKTYIKKNICTQEKVQKILNLFDRLKKLIAEHHPKNIRIKAFELLANLPANITLENNNKITIEYPGPKTQFSYLHEAYTLGSVACLSDLALYYTNGSHCEKTSTPDNEQAYKLLKQYVETTPSAIVYHQLASVCYFRGQDYYDEALLYFDKALNHPTDDLDNDAIKSALLHQSCIELSRLTPESIINAYSYSEQASTIKSNETRTLGFLVATPLYEKLLTLAEQLMEKKNTEPYALDLCMLIGKIYIEKPSIYMYHDTPYTCLRYAADNQDKIAQGLIITNDIPTVNNYTKLRYINYILTTTSTESLNQAMAPYLERYHPKSTKDKYGYIKFLHERTIQDNTTNITNILDEYLVSDYIFAIPQEEYLTDDPEIAQLFCNDTILDKYKKRFIQNHSAKKKLFFFDIGAIFLYAYALMHSDDPKFLNISATYLTRLQDYNLSKKQLARTFLGICYYKLAMHHKNSNNTILFREFLKKSMNLQNQKAIAHMQKTDCQPSQQNIRDDNAKDSSGEAAFILLTQICEKSFPVELGLIQSATTTTVPLRNDLTTALMIRNTNKRKKALLKLFTQRQHPEATLCLASEHYEENNIKQTKEFLTQAFHYSIIHDKVHEKFYFKNSAILHLVSNLFVEKFINNKVVTLHIKNLLRHYQINLDNFIQYIQKMFNVNLSAHQNWK